REMLELRCHDDDRRLPPGGHRDGVVHAPGGAGPSVAEPDDGDVDVGREVVELGERPDAVVADAVAGAPRPHLRAGGGQLAGPLVEHPLEGGPRAIGADPHDAAGELARVWPERNHTEVLADTGGGANGAALAADGSILVTQNGGMDFSKLPLAVDYPYNPATPGLQLATLDGTVRYLVDDGLQAPNDLVVAADGTVYFTDPPHFPIPPEPVGRVMSYSREGALRVVADGFTYCNGIALDRDGTLVVIEGRGLQRLLPDGEREWIVEKLGRGGGDGFCLDTEGNYYVAATVDHGVRIVDPAGKELDFLALEGDGVTTNCCFAGP